MDVLIIYAHPHTGGHCEEALLKLTESLESTKKSYKILDLYSMNYDPILHENEHYTRGNKTISKETEEMQDLLKKADKIVFIYPVWWASMPAILKGYFDKVLTPGFAFKYESGLPIGLLKGKKAAIIITSGGNKLLLKIFMGDVQKKLIKDDILGFCGIKSKLFHIDSATRFTDSQKKKIAKNVQLAIKYLELN